jgi:hypothetical protein
VAFQLYLPEVWSGDKTRRRKAGVPEDVSFRTKPQIALAQLSPSRHALHAACGFLAAAALPAGFEPRGRPRRRRTASSRSIASLRRTIAGSLLRQLARCLSCGALR